MITDSEILDNLDAAAAILLDILSDEPTRVFSIEEISRGFRARGMDGRYLRREGWHRIADHLRAQRGGGVALCWGVGYRLDVSGLE